jgi:hypothetical protein
VIRRFNQITRQADGYSLSSDGLKGLYFKPVERKEFDTFVLRQATSPETGRIGTVFDQEKPAHPDQIIRTLGLYGCEKLCAVAVCVIVPNKADDHNSCRLDTVVADRELRKQGLATFIITKLFMDLLSDSKLNISRMFSYAVHPGTVAALKKLHFSDPPPKGAPLVAVEIDNSKDPTVLSTCETLFGQLNYQLAGACAKCATANDPSRRWCEADPLEKIE